MLNSNVVSSINKLFVERVQRAFARQHPDLKLVDIITHHQHERTENHSLDVLARAQDANGDS